MTWEMEDVRIHKNSKKTVIWAEYKSRDSKTKELNPNSHRIDIRMDKEGYLYTSSHIEHETTIWNHWYDATREVDTQELYSLLKQVLKFPNIQKALKTRGMDNYKGFYAKRSARYAHDDEPIGTIFRDNQLFFPPSEENPA